MSISIGSLKYFVSADISDYTSKMAQLKAARKTASKEEKLAIDKQIKLLRDQQRKEKQILRDRSKAYNDFANTIRSSVKWISVGLVGVVATASKNLMDMERETKNLSAALSNLGLNNQGLLSTLTDLADQINEVTGINQQLINDAMAIGLQFGIAQDDIDEYAKALAALSSISGKSIQQLAQSLNQMYIKGDFSSLEKLGIYIDQNKSKQQQFNDVIAQGVNKYTELNNQTSGTLTRNIRVFGNVAGSVFEEIGKKINDNVIAPLTTWVGTNRELIIKVTSELADTITSNWQHVLATLLTLYSTFNKAAKKQTDVTWSDIKTTITNNWKESSQSVDLFRDKISRMYRLTTKAINALVDWNNMTGDQRRNVILNKDLTVFNRIIASADLLHIKAGKTNKEFFDVNNTLTTTNKILLTTGKILLNNVGVVNTLRVAVSGVTAVAKGLNVVFGTTLVLVKSIGRALVVLAVMEAAIWAIEKAWDGVVWVIEKAWDGIKKAWDGAKAFGEYLHKIGIELGVIDGEQEKLDNLLNTNKSLADQIETANKKNLELTKQLNGETDKQIKQEHKKNEIEELELQIQNEQSASIRQQLKTQLEQTKQLQEINNKNSKLEEQLKEQNKQTENIEENEKEITEQVKTQNVELSNQIDIVNSLYATTADLNKSWNNMVHPVTNINVLYHEYKNLQQEIADKQQEIYSNQQNALIDVETKNKRNIDLVNQYNDLLRRRNTLTQSLLSAKQKQREEEEKAAEAEQEKIKKQLDEQKALDIKRQQLQLQLEIAKAENSGNKDRAEALRIGKEVTNIAKEYKISIEDALKVYRTLNAEKNAGKEGYDAEGNKLTKAQSRRQKRAQEKLKRYEESQATAPGEKRKTGVRRISASKSAVERWRREAAGNFTGRDSKPVLERITANQIKANIPDASTVTPITPSTTGISDQTQISTPQTTGGKSDNILNQIATKIDQMVSGFDTFTQQFAQTFSA